MKNQLTFIQKKFIFLKYIERINDYAQIARFENKEEKTIRKNYNSIDEWYMEKLHIKDEKDYDALKKLIEKICKDYFDNLFKKFNEKRKRGFKSFKNFYKWYKKQEKRCHYCNIEEEKLKDFFEKKLIESKKFNGTLHIERIEPNKEYTKENCVLACAICNNAKSDMISAEDFIEFFVPGIKKFYEKLSNLNRPYRKEKDHNLSKIQFIRRLRF